MLAAREGRPPTADPTLRSPLLLQYAGPAHDTRAGHGRAGETPIAAPSHPAWNRPTRKSSVFTGRNKSLSASCEPIPPGRGVDTHNLNSELVDWRRLVELAQAGFRGQPPAVTGSPGSATTDDRGRRAAMPVVGLIASGLVIVLVVAFYAYLARITHFECPRCGCAFKLSNLPLLFTLHIGLVSLVVCPACGYRGMMTPVRDSG